MRKRLITILIATAVMAASAPAVFADENATLNHIENNITSGIDNEVSSYEYINEIPIFSNIPSALESNSKTVGVLEPALIRSGNSTNVELYLTYTGSLANMIRFKSIVVESSILGVNYKVFKPTSGTYKNISFTASTTAYIK